MAEGFYIGLGGLAEGFHIGLGGQAEGLNLLLNPRYIGLGGQAEGLNLLLNPRYIGLGGQAEGFYIGLRGQIAVEQIDLLGRQNLGLFLGKAVRRQAFDEFIGVEGNGFAHDQRIYAIPAPYAIINAIGNCFLRKEEQAPTLKREYADSFEPD